MVVGGGNENRQLELRPPALRHQFCQEDRDRIDAVVEAINRLTHVCGVLVEQIGFIRRYGIGAKNK